MDFRDKLQHSINNKVLIAIVLGILILVNVLSLQFFGRFDWTRNQQYSISDATIEVLSDLEDIVTVKAYISPDLPPQLLPAEQYVKDILREYEAYGSGNFDAEFVNIADVAYQQEALQSGVQRVEMQVLENDRYQVRQGFFGLTVSYEGETEAIPVIQQQNLGNLEYDLTSLIVKMSQPRLQVVAFLQGHGEHGINRGFQAPGQVNENDYSVFAEALRKNYEVKTVDFAKNQTLEGVDVLIVGGPKRDLTERAMFEIDQYLLQGGAAVFLVDAVELLPNSVTIQPLDVNVKSFLEPLGVTVNSNLVLDALSEFGNFQVGQGRSFIVPYPLFVRLIAENFSQHPIVQKINAFVVRFASSLSIQEKDGLNYNAFIHSSPRSWTQEGPEYRTDPNNIPQPTQDEGGASTIAVEVSGLSPRLSTADSVPVLQEWVENDDKQYELVTVSKDEHRSGREVITEAQAESQVVVYSDSDFVADPFVQGDQTSLVVLLNTVDYLTFGEALISIRSKSLDNAPLEPLENSEKSLMKFLGILFVPLLLSGYGVIRLWMRRKEEKLLKI